MGVVQRSRDVILYTGCIECTTQGEWQQDGYAKTVTYSTEQTDTDRRTHLVEQIRVILLPICQQLRISVIRYVTAIRYGVSYLHKLHWKVNSPQDH
jgi:hypothetical protein